MKSLLNTFPITGRAASVLGFAITGLLAGCAAPKSAAPEVLSLQPAPPREFATDALTDRPDPFEQQFRIDTGESRLTRRTDIVHPRRVRANSRDRMLLKFNLSDWPEPLRPLARLWVGIGASNSFTTEVTINLNFSQNGTGVSTGLNNLTAIDNVALMGCDFAMQDGDVTVEVENRGLPRDVDYKLRAIVYVPGKVDPEKRR